MQKIIFITGCSTGIGYEAACALHQKQYRVIASCRKKEDLTRLEEQGIEALQMDMNDNASIHQGFELLMQKTNGQLDVLINNAGYGQTGALEDIERNTLREQFETNVFGLMELTRLVIPVMRRQKAGRIINMSSILGLISMPFRGAYNASKYAVEGLSDTLRLELQSSGIKVITIEPGPIESRFRDNAISYSLTKINQKDSHFSRQYDFMLNHFREQKSKSTFTCGPDAVIKKIIHAIEAKNPKPQYRVTFPAHFLAFLKRILSVRMLDRFIGFVSRKELGE
ncbi:SDR family NAD(P)-dependent oxidoreductase [Legionella sp. 16cNR16C]|uniref:SDR family NAD(P)-dependent oxidoreductase n=1 Tax=Legionella sp. 16cNR16C TaxID=2905656 RepID=UPI001E562644|nr:SDR family NAD(P)-dependent oxidoreductase [Legionella sp. 16cNR16C]MCE3044248.1 SDR family NAD(P)-dependent oxidoreductase [Legionella sp. 16cNR16C]